MGPPRLARTAAVTALTVLAVDGAPMPVTACALTALAVAARADDLAALASRSLTGTGVGVA